MLCRRMSSPCRRHGWGQSPRRLQSSIRRRQFNHEAKMCACTDIFARPSIAQTRIARKRRSRYDFACGKIPSIFYHEAKMCARTDIFALPSMSHRAAYYAARAAAHRRYLPHGKYHGNIIPRSRNACLQGHFCETVNCADAPLVRGGVSREELHSNSSCGYYTTKQKCVLAQTFLRGRQLRRRTFGAWRRQP